MSAEDRADHGLLQSASDGGSSRSGLAWGTGIVLLGLGALLWPQTKAPKMGAFEAAEFASRPSSLGKGIDLARGGGVAFRLTPDLALTCRIDVFGDPHPEVVWIERGEISDVPVARPADLPDSVASFCRRALEAR